MEVARLDPVPDEMPPSERKQGQVTSSGAVQNGHCVGYKIGHLTVPSVHVYLNQKYLLSLVDLRTDINLGLLLIDVVNCLAI